MGKTPSCTQLIISCSDNDTTGVIPFFDVDGWSVELSNDSISSDSFSIDFKFSNFKDASFDDMNDIQFSNSDNDSLPYTFESGKINYTFGKDYANYRYLHYRITRYNCTSDKIKFIYCK